MTDQLRDLLRDEADGLDVPAPPTAVSGRVPEPSAASGAPGARG